MTKSLYDSLTEKEIDFNYLAEIKEYKLFQPLIEIKAIEKDIDRDEFVYEKKMIIQMILFVAHCFSKESPFLKTSDTAYTTKTLVMDELEMSDNLRERILNYQIPELEEVIKNYISREDNENVREFLIAKNIYDRNLNAANSAIDKNGNIDIEMQAKYFNTAQIFKEKMFVLKQSVEAKNFMFETMKKDFIKNEKSVYVSDLLS